jgi:hypothetical protein
MNRELRSPGLLTDTPLEDEPMTKAYEIARKTGLVGNGTDGPLNKSDLEQIRKEKTLATFEFSIGPAVDLAKLDAAPFPDA